VSTITLRDEFIRCGRKGCKSCPHGPYRYAYWKENGKLRKKYLGRPAASPTLAEATFQARHEHLEACAAERINALCFLLGRRTFTESRKAYRRALRLAEEAGDREAALDLRKAWQEAWGNRR